MVEYDVGFCRCSGLYRCLIKEVLLCLICVGSPSCTETSSHMESFQMPPPRCSKSIMTHPIKECLLTRIEKEAGASGVKTWRKAILLVWREATQHKYANVFLNPVTNDEAPGYR